MLQKSIVLLIACTCIEMQLIQPQLLSESSSNIAMSEQVKSSVILYPDQPLEQQCINNQEQQFEFYASGAGGILKIESQDRYYIKAYYDGDRPDQQQFISRTEYVLELARNYLYVTIRCSDSKQFIITVFQSRPLLNESVPQECQKSISDFHYFTLALSNIGAMRTLIVQSVSGNKKQLNMRLGRDQYFSGLYNSATTVVGNNIISKNKGIDPIYQNYILEIQSSASESVMYATVDSDVAYLIPNQQANIKKQLTKSTITYYYSDYTEKEYNLLIFTADNNMVRVEIQLFTDDLIGAIKQFKMYTQQLMNISQTIKLSRDVFSDNCQATQNCRMLIRLTNESQLNQIDIEIRLETADNIKQLVPGVINKDVLNQEGESKYEFKLYNQVGTLQVKLPYGTLGVFLNQQYNNNRLNTGNYINEVIFNSHNFEIEASNDCQNCPFTLKLKCQQNYCQYSLNLSWTTIDDNDDEHFTLWWLVIVGVTLMIGIVWSVGNHFYRKQQVQRDNYISI